MYAVHFTTYTSNIVSDRALSLPWKPGVLARAQFEVSHSGNKQYTHSPIAQTQNINKSHWCIWYRWVKSVSVLQIVYGKSLMYWLAPLVCPGQWYFQMHVWCRPSSWVIFITARTYSFLVVGLDFEATSSRDWESILWTHVYFALVNASGPTTIQTDL